MKLILKNSWVEIDDDDRRTKVTIKPREGPTSKANPAFVYETTKLTRLDKVR